MNLILQKDVKNLGKAGDQVSVKNGFARNFLIPKGYALLLNKNRLRAWKHQEIIITAKKRKAVSERKKLVDRLSSIKLIFEKESQKDNKIFGSVTAHEISQALEEQYNISVDKKDIHFSELKTVGNHKINIRLDSEHQTEILLTINRRIRKKKEELSVKKMDQNNISLTADTVSLSETIKSKDQSLSQPSPPPAVSEKAVKKEDKALEDTPAQGKTDSLEQTSETLSVLSPQKETERKSQPKDKSEQEKAFEVETAQKQVEKQISKKDIKPERQEESLAGNRQAQLKKQEKPSGKKEPAEIKAQSLSQDKTEMKKESKKAGGFFKKLFGKKK